MFRTAKSTLRRWHRAAVLNVALRQSRHYLAGNGAVPKGLPERLMYGWGNEGWSAKPPLIEFLLTELRGFSGTILECGSGLSTVLFGIRATHGGARFITLEHHEEWHALMEGRLRNLGLDRRGLRFTKILRYDDYDWYDDTALANSAPFDFVLCDGPPNQTRGGRYGLLPRMFSLLSPGALIVVDDSHRAEEAQIIQRWLAEYQGSLVHVADHGTFTVLRKVAGQA